MSKAVTANCKRTYRKQPIRLLESVCLCNQNLKSIFVVLNFKPILCLD